MRRPVPSVSVSPVTLEDRSPAGRLARLFQADLRRQSGSAPTEALRPGLNFAVQDYLGLATHPTVRTAAQAMPRDAQEILALLVEYRLAAALNLSSAVTFASGTDAIRQTLAAVLTPDDEVLVDSAAPQPMFDAIGTSGAALHRFPAGSLESVERRLSRLARQPHRGRLVIAVPAVSARASKVSGLADLSALARLHGALLIVDVSHDFGSMGQEGGGVLEIQGCPGRADIVLGSLAKCFGAAGGFAAFRNPDLAAALRDHARPLSPASAGTILAATGIAFGPEGSRRRRLLHRISLRLRNHLMADGARVMGQASPLVPILLPAESAMHRAALLESVGPRVRLLQAPTVPRQSPRWRIELSALHSPADIDDLAELIRDVTGAFDRVPVRQRVAV